ncbi:MAG: hypothetical protein K6B43_06500 [Treponema sp.]|nr:hypothetical protein [Treponema sp.]
MKKLGLGLFVLLGIKSAFAVGVNVDDHSVSFETPDLKTKLSLENTELSGKKVSWSVENPYIVSVDENGTVVSLSGGETVVSAFSDGAKVDFSIKVEEPNRAPTKDVVDAKNLSGKIDVIMCGDSIMRDYAPNNVDQYGLGQAMTFFWDSEKANVDNSVSNGGRSSRYFWNEISRWKVVKEKLQENKKKGITSVVFFSFGHNDQRSLSGGDSKVGEYGASFTFAEKNQNGTVAGTFYDYMERYIVETRALGGIPVMVSPFVRKYISGGKITEKGKHNLEGKSGNESSPRGNYPEAMKKACEKHNAIFVDMTNMSADLVSEFDKEGLTKLFYISSDSTHERKFGAFELASLVTSDLKKQGYFSEYIVSPKPKIFVGAKEISFGRCDVNTQKIISFDVSLLGVDSGKINLKAPKGYSLSLSKDGEYSSALSIDCSKIKFGTEIFVKFNPVKKSSYDGKIEISHENAEIEFGNFPDTPKANKKQKISVSGAGKEKFVDGKNFSVTWALTDEEGKFIPGATAKSASENASKLKIFDVKLSGLESLAPKREFSPDDDGNYAAIFNVPGGKWDINDSGAKNDDIYIEFALSAASQNVVINGFSFNAGSASTKNMRWHAYYSTDKKFKNPTPFVKNGSMKHNDVTEEFSTSEALSLPLKGKETIYVRIYPANKDTKESTESAFMLSSFMIYGLIR